MIGNELAEERGGANLHRARPSCFAIVTDKRRDASCYEDIKESGRVILTPSLLPGSQFSILCNFTL